MMVSHHFHRPLEDVLAGYYSFGTGYYVLVGSGYKHSGYTAVHERTHTNLGASTNTGVFQQFLAFLSSYAQYDVSPQFVAPLFDHSIKQVRMVHEAAATNCEFCAAEHEGYEGLAEMEFGLPEDYRKWRDIFRGFLPQSFAPWVRGNLSYHLARYALNSSILVDYCDISDEKLRAFDEYMCLDSINPSRRLETILEGINEFGKERFFVEYLDFYGSVANKLKLAYAVRTIENRRSTFEIQKSFLAIMDRAILRLASRGGIFSQEGILGETAVQDINRLIDNWILFFHDQGYARTMRFSFVNTDGGDADPLDDNLVTVSPALPQSGLRPFEASDLGTKPQPCFIRMWIWKREEPFILCENPRRELCRGDYYIRLFPEGSPQFCYFHVSSDPHVILGILKRLSAITLIDGEDYPVFQSQQTSRKMINQLFVNWAVLDQFKKCFPHFRCTKLRMIRLQKSETTILLASQDPFVFHIFRSVGKGMDSHLVDTIAGDMKDVQPLPIPDASVLFALNMLDMHFSQLI